MTPCLEGVEYSRSGLKTVFIKDASSRVSIILPFPLHFQVHEGVKYICDQCGFDGANPKALDNHIKVSGQIYPLKQLKGTQAMENEIISRLPTDICSMYRTYMKKNISPTLLLLQEFVHLYKSNKDFLFTKVVHEGYQYMCKECDYVGSTYRLLWNHRNEEHKE